MQIKQFVKADELSTELFDRPYFVVPKDDVQAKALGIMRKAIAQDFDTFGIGEDALLADASIWWQFELPLIQNKRG